MTQVFFCKNIRLVNLDVLSGFCEERKNYILSFSDHLRRNQSVVAWCLLEYVLKKHYSFNSVFGRQNNGKWKIDNFEGEISITHCENVVAIALSSDNVGIDVEKISNKILPLSKKYGTDDIEELTRIWAEKESKFKSLNASNVYNSVINDGKDTYVLSLSHTKEKVEMKEISFDDIIKIY